MRSSSPSRDRRSCWPPSWRPRAWPGSLYFSEVADFIPCTLCWYQRIAMYPLVVILGIAAVRRDRDVWLLRRAPRGHRRRHLPLPLHRRVVPRSATPASAAPRSPAAFVWFRVFGFVSLPFMALCGFALILTLVTLPPRRTLMTTKPKATASRGLARPKAPARPARPSATR